MIIKFIKNKVIYLSFILLITNFVFFTLPVKAATFNPNFILSDEEMLDNTSMTLSDINRFLASKGGYISRHKFKNYKGEMKTAAEIIFDATNNNYDCAGTEISVNASDALKKEKCVIVHLNPKVILVLLQKEMSLIEETSPTQRQLNFATGYGCPDGQDCNDRWTGFGKQVNSAALQFFDYMQNPHLYTYKTGGTYTVTNAGKPSSVISPLNNATAAFYNYTPHVYNGNYNFFKLWMRYFTHTYPNNTLLQARGEPGVWLIQNDKKRAFLTRGALTSRYDINKVVQVNKSELEKYPTGAPIKFPQYSLIRSPRGTVFLLVDDKRRGIASGEAFRKIGFNPEEIIDASWEDINAYEEGPNITATSSHPTGALLQNNKTGGIYFVSEGTKAPLWDASLLKNKYKWKSITPVDPEKLASYKTVEPAIFSDGELLKSADNPGVFVIDSKKKRPFTSGEIFEELGYKWSNIITVPQKILDLYEDGEPISKIYTEDDTEIVDPGVATSSTENLASTTADIASGTNTNLLSEEINDILNP